MDETLEEASRGGLTPAPAAAWRSTGSLAEVLFVGKMVPAPSLASLLPVAVEPAWLEQVHSSDVVRARAGDCGRGDALVSDRRRLGLAVVTADCLPILLASEKAMAAVHAGWRGLAGGIIERAVEGLRQVCGDAEKTAAWIGPAIGACCYEVSDEVASQVVEASGDRGDLVTRGPRGRPHLDLVSAAKAQLAAAGVAVSAAVDVCTRCDEDWWSYRRDGSAAGRNYAAIWRA